MNEMNSQMDPCFLAIRKITATGIQYIKNQFDVPLSKNMD